MPLLLGSPWDLSASVSRSNDSCHSHKRSIIQGLMESGAGLLKCDALRRVRLTLAPDP